MIVAVHKNFCLENFFQIIIKASVADSFLVKFHAFSIIFWTPLDGCIWSMKIILGWLEFALHCFVKVIVKSTENKLLIIITYILF